MKVSLGTVGDSWIKVPKLLNCIVFTRNAKVDVAEISEKMKSGGEEHCGNTLCRAEANKLHTDFVDELRTSRLHWADNLTDNWAQLSYYTCHPNWVHWGIE